MSWTPKNNLHNSATNLDWVAWGNKMAMYDVYKWKNSNNHSWYTLAGKTKNKNWVSKVIDFVRP